MAKGYAPVYCDACRHPARACSVCGTTFRAPSRRTATCSPACRSLAAVRTAPAPTGRDHWNWKGGADYYRGPGWRHIRDAVRDRDGWRCVDCGADRRGKKLDVHHIVAAADWSQPGAANDMENLVSLCPGCHRTRERHAA
jgi:5-methylcytosine-specific restriction endonuclease McrA